MDDLDRLVAAARAGDAEARERLVHEHLPLVYNVVGRAMDGHADVDDVVQDTMLRALRGLGGLRDPARFKSWLVAIAMNQVRRRWRAQRERPVLGLDENVEVMDPSADFVDVTIARLGLTGQRREVAQATRWLDETDRDLLALWWLEAAGALTRAELATAAGLSSRHAAVRVKRMKEQLDTGRTVVRALAADPRCGELEVLTEDWDGRPSPLWRKRIARHARGCRVCSGRRDALVPAEMLLAGLALVPLTPVLLDSAPRALVSAASSLPAAPVDISPASSGGYGLPGGGWTVSAVGAAATAAVVIIAVLPEEPTPPANTISVSPVPDAGKKTTRVRAPRPPAEADRLAPRTTPPPAASGPEAQVVALTNTERAKSGCGPLRADPRLTTAARRHSADMAARGFFDHTNPDGKGPGDRIDATGFRWSSWAENIAKGQGTPASVMTSWTTSPGHKANIVNCRFSLIGVGLVTGSGGPYWTQVFATPR